MSPLHSRWSLSAMIYHHKPFLRDFYVRLPVCLYHLFYLLAPLHKGWMLMMTTVPILITFVPPFILLPSNDWMTNHHSTWYLYLLVGRSIREGHIWFIKRTKISNPCDLLWTLKLFSSWPMGLHWKLLSPTLFSPRFVFALLFWRIDRKEIRLDELNVSSLWMVLSVPVHF
jgi:hypothetical protein